MPISKMEPIPNIYYPEWHAGTNTRGYSPVVGFSDADYLVRQILCPFVQ
jgi:hypothetical protein